MPPIPANVQPRDLSTLASRLAGAWDALRGRPFSPGAPIAPASDLQEQTDGPRQFQYPVGVNTQYQPRGEQLKLTPFEQLRNIAALYDVAALCIATRTEELQGLPWAIVAKNKRDQAAENATCDAVAKAFGTPDGLSDFNAWIGMLLYDLFSIDAATIYKRPDRGGGLHSLEVVDGTTIKPLLDERGRTVAYQQILYGVPRSAYGRPMADELDEELPIYAPHELLYRPRWTRSFTPYGFPPTEWVILRVNTALRKQAQDLSRFTDSNIPAMLISPPDGMLDPKQVAEFEEWFNAVLEGNEAARRKAKFLPWAANIRDLHEMSEGGRYESALDEWMLKITCAAYGVTPAELGFTSDVNRATADSQENVGYRRGIGPLTRWLKIGIFDPVIQGDLGQTQLEFRWLFGEHEDRAAQANTDSIYLERGVVSPDEIRTLRFADELDGPAPGPPAPPGGAPVMPPGDFARYTALALGVPDYLLKAEDDYSQATRENREAYDRRRRDSPTHQKKIKARAAVRAAIDRGDLKPASERQCGYCDSTATAYHHINYDDGGLNVKPICDSCNTRLAHKERKFAKRAAEDAPDRSKQERAAAQAISAAYAAQQRRVQAAIRAHEGPDPREALADLWQAEPGRLTQALLPLFDDVLADAAADGLSQLSVGVDWDMVNDAVLQLAQERAAAFSASATATSQKQLDRLIADWIANGGTMDELIDRADRVWGGPRADVAAVTTVTDLFATGNAAAWQASGVVGGYRVNTAQDEAVCPICGQHQGQEYPIDDTDNLPSYHGHCRCWVTPVVKGPDEL